MQFRALGSALAIALISILLMLGALSVSLVEHVPEITPTATSLPSLVPIASTPTLQSAPATPLFLETFTPTVTFTPTITATPPKSCPVPQGWGQVVVQPYDTLESIAARYNTTASKLSDSNCLMSSALVAGSVLYVPPVPTNTVPACVPGTAGWINNYVVRSGDTFYSIARSYGTTATLLKAVNCRVSDLIYSGEILWTPNRPTFTPAAPTSTIISVQGVTVTPQPTDPLTATALPFTSTPVPSATPIPPTQPPTLTASPTVFP